MLTPQARRDDFENPYHLFVHRLARPDQNFRDFNVDDHKLPDFILSHTNRTWKVVHLEVIDYEGDLVVAGVGIEPTLTLR